MPSRPKLRYKAVPAVETTARVVRPLQGVAGARRGVVAQSLVSGVTAMSISDHWLIQRHSKFECDKNIDFRSSPGGGGPWEGLGAQGSEVQ
jgi:hypothetical protein